MNIKFSSLANLHRDISLQLSLTPWRHSSILASLTAWSGVNEDLWAENFNCSFIELAEALLEQESLMQDFLTNYYRGNLSVGVRQHQVHYVIMRILTDICIYAELHSTSGERDNAI